MFSDVLKKQLQNSNSDGAIAAFAGGASGVNTDFLKSLMQMYNSNSELTSIPIAEYHSLFKELMRDEIQIILPKD